ncbi:AAA family ATPase [Porphyrobacter algicida]|uniref:AAA family ATPase n=1 Tax=Qipengyuania algicida TaxID=1836209 RepID=A0A845AHU6_9SPHN|nr:AAA family ATPase [Qipengyuania algicida]MXP28491.1 AAA family ATPase [Qipengyuania algicida]
MLIGHEGPWREWRSALAGERIHHAWLLTGKAGLGKYSFAEQAARELVGSPPDQAQHPDILLVSHPPKDDSEDRKRAEGKPFEKARSIRIAQIRAMQQRLNTRPTLGERRVIIIDPADDLERNAANALLKSLEEPPNGTFFILISHSPARLLPTIRSRCRTLRFPTLPDEKIANLLAEHMPDADAATRAAAATAAAGSPGAALKFVELGLGAPASVMRAIMGDGDPAFLQRGKLAELIGARPDRERLRAVLDLARAELVSGIEALDRGHAVERIAIHQELVRLTGEFTTYNYDPGLLAMEIGTLLARAGQASDRAYG